MASFRPATRILARRLINTPTSTTSSLLLRSPRILISTTTTTLPFQQPNTFTRHISDKVSPENAPIPVPGPSSLSDLPSGSDPTPDESPKTGSVGTPPAGSHLESGIPKSTIYNYKDIELLSDSLSSSSSSASSPPKTLLIDVREQSEVLGTGLIPGAKNIPISTSPDSFFLSAEEFEDRFGFSKPDKDQEVVFYCKAGVRSKAAARLAGQAGFGGKVGEFPGSWVEWAERGGKIERFKE